MVQDIEFVCSGGNGRSPIAKAVATRYAEQKGLEEIRLTCSGTRVNFLKTATEDEVLQAVLPYIPAILEGELISPEDAEQLRNGERVRELLYPILGLFTKRETQDRNQILEEKGLIQYINRYDKKPRQIRRARCSLNSHLILPIGTDNFDIVCQMYSQGGFPPTIECLGDFEDGFFRDIHAKRKIADQIEAATIKSMEKYL